jgi:hypothetical protein
MVPAVSAPAARRMPRSAKISAFDHPGFGDTPIPSLKHVLINKRANRSGGVTIESLIERGIVIRGAPDTVRRRLCEAPSRI